MLKKVHRYISIPHVAAEQAALPYKWTQTLEYVDVLIPVPEGTRARDLAITIKQKKLSAGLKGKEPIIEVFPAFRTKIFTDLGRSIQRHQNRREYLVLGLPFPGSS